MLQEPQEPAPSASAEQLAEAATAHKITPAQAYQRFFAAPPADANESSARVSQPEPRHRYVILHELVSISLL